MDQNISDGNRRIARNSIFMSIRMVIVLLIALYTTRVLLSVLGVQDYGVYNVVCGFVSMFTFLSTSMSNGIQRFFNYELGKNGVDGANKVFNTSLIIQILITIIIVVLCESFGLWYLNNKMVIPPDRIFAAKWIFQLSMLSFAFTIMQSPFSAAIMAHERMDFYALVGILDAFLKLMIVFTLPFFNGDQLIIYGILFSFIGIADFLLYSIYAKRNFQEIHFSYGFERKLFLSMIGFSGWNLFGSFANMMREQGLNLVINLFFGPVVNAARGVASQVSSGIQGVVQNIMIPVRPQVVQSYAKENYVRVMSLTYSVSKISSMFMYIIALPIILELEFILHIWLGDNIPAHTSNFIIIAIITTFVCNLNAAVSNVVHASGKMKVYQITGSLAILTSIPLAYATLKLGLSAEWALIMGFISMTIAQIVALFVLKSIIDYSYRQYLTKTILPFALVFITSFWVPVIPHFFMDEGLLRFITVGIVSVLSVTLSIFVIGLNKSERELILDILGKKLFRK